MNFRVVAFFFVLCFAHILAAVVKPNEISAAQGKKPPLPPEPEAWEFRRELAEDPPPAYEAPHGTAWLENRISRCFFSPIKRPPFNRDELKEIAGTDPAI